MGAPERGVYCNRTLNLRRIRAIGYDMDYTLIHYKVEEWERAAFDHAARYLATLGWPTDALRFDAASVIQGLVVDTEKGNIVKPTRFGYIVRAQHGGHALSYEQVRDQYGSTSVDLEEDRWQFLHTLFSLSEGCLYLQCTDLLDRGLIAGTLGYRDLYRTIRKAISEVHTRGELKREIISSPERFVVPDPDVGMTLLDQKSAGKVLMLVSNSDWRYANAILTFAIDPFLPDRLTWRDLFDFVIVEARKPRFFLGQQAVFVMVDENEGLLQSHGEQLVRGAIHIGGDARRVEESLGLSGAEILYVGDHMFGDVNVSKSTLRWRTGLVVRELESEIEALLRFRPEEQRLRDLMAQKSILDGEIAQLRLDRLRARSGVVADSPQDPNLEKIIRRQTTRSAKLDTAITPLARAANELGNPTWGPLLRSGNDKSLFALQLEAHADIYTSRVSNLLRITPFGYLRASRSSLPHDP
jgi:5'-nucleotidase